MALTKTKSVIVTSGTTNAAGTGNFTRGRLTLPNAYGGIVTMKIQNNGALGAQCEGRILISHEDTLPAADSAGADWKTVYRFGGGTVSGVTTEQSFGFGPEVRHIEIEFNGNTTNSVTVEAEASTFSV